MMLRFKFMAGLLNSPAFSEVQITQKTKGGNTMKFKRTVLLAAFVVTMGLLLGTSATQAATVIKVVAEGDTLLDGTILTSILVDGGVAINLDGKVAFGGKDDDGTDAVFTQDEKVVAEGDTLPDETILPWFRQRGQVAISAGQSGDTVAFHGIANTGATYTAAVFTQDGVVAAVGDPLAEGTLDQINDSGKVAINNWNEVAFHGSVEIESDAGSKETFRAVFISDGLDTRVVAREDTNLLDETYLDNITESGRVAINDRGEVAFHGQTVDPASDVLLPVPAVFTSNGLAAREGSELPDGNTLEKINDNGGVAINLLGEVAFQGLVYDPAISGLVQAVFTQNGLVAKNGNILPDGTMLSNISTSAGVAINLYGDVVFHGTTGDGDKAVFTQNGLVAKVGQILDDGTTFWDIYDQSGAAINPYGSEVPFLGAGIPDTVVFVGQAPLPPAP
jgi:phage tail protein X